MYNFDFETENYNNKFDTVIGTVIDHCSSGVFLELENGEPAFTHFCQLTRGQRVFCYIRKKATDRFRTLVEIDSIICERTTA